MTSNLLERLQQLALMCGRANGFKIEISDDKKWYEISIGGVKYICQFGLCDEELINAYFYLGAELRLKNLLQLHGLSKDKNNET